MIERHHPERALAAAVKVLRDMGERRGALGAVPARHAFRPPGRARGVEQQATDPRLLPERLTVPRGRMPIGRTGSVPPSASPSAIARQISAPLAAPGNRLGRNRIEDDRARLGIGKAVIELVGLEPPVERRHDDAEKLAGPMQARHLEPVLQDDRKPVAALQAEPAEPGCDRGKSPRYHCGVAEPPRAIDDRHRVGAALDRLRESCGRGQTSRA